MRSRTLRVPLVASIVSCTFLMLACADHSAPSAPADGSTDAPQLSASLVGLPGSSTPVRFATLLAGTECLDASLGAAGKPAPVQLWSCGSAAGQQFTWRADGTIRTYDGSMCLDDSGAKGLDGDRIIIWSCHGAANQRWQPTSAGEIRGINGKCVDVASSRTANGTRIVLWTCHGGTNQHWDARSATGTSTPAPSPSPTPSTATLHKVSGDAQSATFGAAVAQPLVVQLLDAAGHAVSGAKVTWTSSGGIVSPTTATTDATGHASTKLTLSPTFFTTTATATSGTKTVTFTSVGNGSASLGGRRPFPSTNAWNQDISTAPIDPNSATLIANCGAGRVLHPDFGTVWNGAPNGIPYIIVHGTQAKVPVSFRFATESDPGPYPIPPNAPVQGGPNATGDRHLLIVDWDHWKAYELFDARPVNGGTSWTAGSGAIFDLGTGALRPAGWTSADAAGLPMFPGLVRYDEVAALHAIQHALRMSCDRSRNAYIAPARHAAGDGTSTNLPPMGMRVRLKASVDISHFSAANQVILRALERYGAFVADDGVGFMISGAPDPRWNDGDLHNLQQITANDFEVVKMGPATPYP